MQSKAYLVYFALFHPAGMLAVRKGTNKPDNTPRLAALQIMMGINFIIRDENMSSKVYFISPFGFSRSSRTESGLGSTNEADLFKP